MSEHRYEGKPLTLSLSEEHVIELPPRLIRVRLRGLMFDTDKAFLLPKAMRGMRGLVDLYSEHEDLSVVVSGHADRVGSSAYNVGLSDERVQAIVHFLRDEAEQWLRWYDDQPYSSPWGVREDQSMLSAVVDPSSGTSFYEGDIDGINGTGSQDAVRRFQQARGLSVDGIAGPQTRKALIEDYMALDGTSLPAEADVSTVACGEHHPAVQTLDGEAHRDNRRVEVFLFDPGPPTPQVPSSCPGAGCPYETWVEKLVETYDIDHDLGTLVVECTNNKGAPLDRSSIELVRETETERTHTTGDDGRARFDALLPGTYLVRAKADGYDAAHQEVTIEAGDAFVSLTLEPTIDWSFFTFEVQRVDDDPTHEEEDDDVDQAS